MALSPVLIPEPEDEGMLDNAINMVGNGDYMGFHRHHWRQISSTNPLERLIGEIKRRTDVVAIFPKDAAIMRLAGALLLERNDVYGPPPACKEFRPTTTNSVLAVVYPALSRGHIAAGPDGIRGSAAEQWPSLKAARIIS